LNQNPEIYPLVYTQRWVEKLNSRELAPIKGSIAYGVLTQPRTVCTLSKYSISYDPVKATEVRSTSNTSINSHPLVGLNNDDFKL